MKKAIHHWGLHDDFLVDIMESAGIRILYTSNFTSVV